MAAVRAWATRALSVPKRLWEGSLPLRIITTTFVLSTVVMIIGIFVIVESATSSIVAGKRDDSINEAATVLSRMQDQLGDSDLRAASLYERLSQLAVEASNKADYGVMIESPVSGFISRGISMDSVPGALRTQVTDSDGLFVTNTLVVYTTTGRASDPGLAIGGVLHATSGERFPVYFIFPMTGEAATIATLSRVIWATGALVVVGLMVIAYLVSRQVSKPVRQARQVATQIASGDFDQRMPVKGTDDLAGLAIAMNNMASELQAQITQLENLSMVQRQFVSDVSHELRTPLTTVKMATEVLYSARSDFDETSARTTELLHDEVDRFDVLFADLLEISRFDAGAAVLHLDEVDLVEVVRSELDDLAMLATSMDAPVELMDSAPVVAEVDTKRIRRIVRNLITNAIEHGEHRLVVVEVAGNDSAAAVRVRDHGIGFEPEQSELVFNRFWRADPARKRTVGGTGLGLSIALADAKLHDGWLEAYGEPTHGAVFRLTVPRVAGRPIETAPLALTLSDELDPTTPKAEQP